ncbi:hypothetical protein CCYN49044_70020 [Capnocytophaga cynodegmi]|uniref:Uncharacterized protein n=1 Tax=Capnocytophaga cynodegmi TaxID=28189 RepID=A0A0B7HB43_9FLAO|nr:hypothetical protein CCYN74_200045 [Capnocytophaga cynodegmi]CEN42177.1 hypothetical protein CCYN49044_70020 [Capnocytophaga cynodegmi]
MAKFGLGRYYQNVVFCSYLFDGSDEFMVSDPQTFNGLSEEKHYFFVESFWTLAHNVCGGFGARRFGSS